VVACFAAIEAGTPVNHPGRHETESHDQGGVADQSPYQGRLDQRDQALLNAEDPDQEVG
jgi:hypothetical protein